MAVKASCTVTLSCYRDTQSVTRYYKLQSSTSAAPAKPTTKPPSGWNDTEPSYTSGSTNTLYFCDLTVFSDGTWAYSTVSKSSSYEAAKEAYNKAVAAGNTANSVKNTVNSMTKTIFSSSTPTDTSVLWIDTSETPPLAKKYNPDTVKWEVVNDSSEVIQSVRKEISGVIDQIPEKISSTVESKTYLKGEVDKLVSQLNTIIEQLDNEVSIKISRVEGSVTDLEGNINATLADYITYFEFKPDGLYIGTNTSVIKLRQSNDRLSFLENGTEVAYVSNRKLYITDAEITGSLMIANFGFIQEINNSLSFGKVR